jgi:hypothetical protein
MKSGVLFDRQGIPTDLGAIGQQKEGVGLSRR